ncbi:hypothetical protein IV203_000372 [Nitzschia inconspicua]|uniref:Uncharacterized protein n=1 Tax=Nitzschia inconspicua TaxID=303405 RepID=A0A9K3L6F2_9STRA|nr:hypothetical protein IV203_000372 [Nitzschia inconspicua]
MQACRLKSKSKVQLITKGLSKLPPLKSDTCLWRGSGSDSDQYFVLQPVEAIFDPGCFTEVLYPPSIKFIITKREGNKVFMTELVENEVEESVVSLISGAEKEPEAAIISVTVHGPSER